MSGNEVRERKTSLWFRISLVLLSVVIIGLVIGIVLVNISRGGEVVNNSQEEYYLPEELMEEDLSPEGQTIKDVSIMLQTPGTSMEDIEAYYDGVISKANEDKNYYLAIDVIVQKLLFLTGVEGDCGKAKSYSENIDTSMYSEEEKGYLQSNVHSVLMDCEDLGEDE